MKLLSPRCYSKYDTRYHNQQSKEAISLEIIAFLARNAFAFLPMSKILPELNVLGGHIIKLIKIDPKIDKRLLDTYIEAD